MSWPQNNTEDAEAAAEEAKGEIAPLLKNKDTGKINSAASAGGLGDLQKHFGSKLLITLFASQHLMKGFGGSFTGGAVKFLYKDYAVAGPQMQVFGGVTQLPWAMKPIIGLASDIFPVMGFHKMPYIFLTTVIGIFATATIGLVPQSALSLTHLVICLFLATMMYSVADLLTEAKYAEKMAAVPAQGPALMSFVWGGLHLGALVATICIGPVLDIFGNKAPFVIVLLPLSFILLPLMWNYLEETPKSEEALKEHRQSILRQREAPILCFIMFVGTVFLSVLGIYFQSVPLNAGAAVIVAIIMLISFSITLRPVIAKVNALSLVQTSMSLSISGASFYFFTDDKEQYPEGPHFSKEFYTSVLGTFGSLCSLVGIATYQRYASQWTYRRIMILTNVFASLMACADLLLYSRMNLRLGIPDHVFVMGTSAFEEVLNAWMWMPSVVIMSQLCPEGMEATMYALLAGCHNLGNTVSASGGAVLLQWLDVQPRGSTGESQQFDKLWIAALIAIVLPLFTIVLIPWMIPDARQTDKLLPEGDRDATKGSLLRRWQGLDIEG